jgi:hypothetical protein
VCGDDVAPSGRLVFAFDANPERNAASIATASKGQVPDAELLEDRFGVGWVVDRAVELDGRHGPTEWLVDGSGPAGALIPEFERRGLRVRQVVGRESVSACGAFFDAVIDGKVAIRSDERLDNAVAGAAKRQVGDAWCWTRKSATANVAPLVALTLAVWGARDPAADAAYHDLADYLEDEEV